MPSPALHTLFRKESFSPSERRPGGIFAPARRKNLSVTPAACHCPGCGSKRLLRLSLASCWPLPQQLLPVSAAGGGRRRCSYRGEALAYRKASASSPEAPLQGELSAKQTERLYGGKPDRERKPLPRGAPFHLHDTAPLRWNKWRSSYKLNDTSLNISCSPTWRSSPDWRSTYFASWAQVRHLGEVCFTALVR